MARKSPKHPPDPKNVFVVHGRNTAAREAMFAFLRAIGLHPLDWEEMVNATGNGSPYIGEVLAAGFSHARAVVVLMTPDDEARVRSPYRLPDDHTYETKLTPQARPNVLLEAGMALGLDASRTILVEIGQLRPASDIGGRHIIKMNNSTKRRESLAQRLEMAGCCVNRGEDWLREGDFEGALPLAATNATDVLEDANQIMGRLGALLKSQRQEPRAAQVPEKGHGENYSLARLRGILQALLRAFYANELYIPELLIAQREMQKAGRDIEIAVLKEWASVRETDDTEPHLKTRGMQARRRLLELDVKDERKQWT